MVPVTLGTDTKVMGETQKRYNPSDPTGRRRLKLAIQTSHQQVAYNMVRLTWTYPGWGIWYQERHTGDWCGSVPQTIMGLTPSTKMTGWPGIFRWIPVLQQNFTPFMFPGIINLGYAPTSHGDALIHPPSSKLISLDRPWGLIEQLQGHMRGTLSGRFPSQRNGSRSVALCLIIYHGVLPPMRMHSQLCLGHLQISTEIGSTCLCRQHAYGSIGSNQWMRLQPDTRLGYDVGWRTQGNRRGYTTIKIHLSDILILLAQWSMVLQGAGRHTGREGHQHVRQNLPSGNI